MLARLWNRTKYWIERKFVHGAYRLLLIAALIGLISILGGAAVLAGGTGFGTVGEAVWWAFLRLTDPGYLGDDVGTVNRVVSTVLTVLGYVVFLGALVAVMTQWLNARMSRLESGLTSVARNDHILVLGMNNRTTAIIREMLLSEGRVKRFLRRHGTRDLHVVVMAEEVNARVAQNLRDAVGEAWSEDKVTLRSGTPLRVEHLARVDAANASVIIVPGSEFDGGGAEKTDSYTVKTLLSLSSGKDTHLDGALASHTIHEAWPLVVAEIFDARKIPIARKAYPGPLEIMASDAIVSRLLAQNVRHRGLSHVFNEILTHEGGSELYLRTHPELAGLPFGRLGGAFEKSVLLGVVRPIPGGYTPHLNPPGDFVVEEDDRFVHLAADYEHAAFSGKLPREPWPRGTPGADPSAGVVRRILLLGWNHKVPALIQEFNTYANERFEITMMSVVSAATRQKALTRYGDIAPHVVIDYVDGDYAEPSELEELRLDERDAVVIVGRDRRQGAEESDARTIMGSLLLAERGIHERGTQTILELLDPDNVRLLDATLGEVIISPLILSHMLAHVALRPELGTVFTELFTHGGAEITFRPLSQCLPKGHSEPSVSFLDLQRAAHARGEIALGVQVGSGSDDLQLGPELDHRYDAATDLQVVTLTTVS